MTKQEALTVVTEVKPGKIDDLKNLLAQITANDVEDNNLVPFKRLTTVHFARFVVLDEAKDAQGQTIPPSLVFSTNFDAPLDDHLQELVTVAGAGLSQIYSHCIGYPDGANGEALLTFLRAHRLKTNTFYVGTRGRSVQQIRQEDRLRQAIQDFLDQARTQDGWEKLGQAAVRAKIQEFVKHAPEFAWALTPSESPFFQKLKDLGTKIFLGLGLIVIGTLLLPVLLFVLLIWVVILRQHEERDPVDNSPLDLDRVHRLIEAEDQIVQNQFSHVVAIKPGGFRLITVRAVLGLIDFAARYYFNQGTLGGIPSIHFARWVIIDQGRRLLFLSNFDGSWENYLGDFIDKAAAGLTAVWSNTVGFPKTSFLIHGGAQDEQPFKACARRNQVFTQVWYSAYKLLTVSNINDNTQLRLGLVGELTAPSTAKWLRRL